MYAYIYEIIKGDGTTLKLSLGAKNDTVGRLQAKRIAKLMKGSVLKFERTTVLPGMIPKNHNNEVIKQMYSH
jgi:hypothetical protein